MNVNDTVLWLGNKYIIVELKNDKVRLKQKFSIGTELDWISIKELDKI